MMFVKLYLIMFFFLYSEVAERLQEINDVKAALADAQASIQRKEQEIIRIHKMVSFTFCNFLVCRNSYQTYFSLNSLHSTRQVGQVTAPMVVTLRA